MPVLSLACHLPHNTPHIPSRYNNEQTTKQTKAINNSYIYINITCKCDTNRAGHFTLDAYASRPVACDVMAWELRLSALLAHCDWNSSHKGPVIGVLMCSFLWAFEEAVEQIVEWPVIWDTITIIWPHCYAHFPVMVASAAVHLLNYTAGESGKIFVDILGLSL